VQTFVYRKPKLAPDLGQQYQYRYQGEGLGIRLDDGRAVAVKRPALWIPPDYKPYDKDVVLRFAAEQKLFPIELRSVGTGPPRGFVFDDAVSPSQAWRLDWQHAERTLGRGARIVRFDMTPTREQPTFDLGKAVPWVVIDRRKSPQQMMPSDEDVWFGFEAFRAKLKSLDVREEAKDVTLTEEAHQTKWLDASERFSRTGMWSLAYQRRPPGSAGVAVEV
jgi:hypothetical protein